MNKINNVPRELSDTVDMMISEDYKDRLKAEYYQLNIRADALRKILRDWEMGKLKFKPTCDYGFLLKQFQLMDEYRMILRVRAQIEGIEL